MPLNEEKLEQLRKHEDGLISQRANIFIVAHALLVAAIGVSSPKETSRLAVVVLGVVLSLFWVSSGIRHRSLMNWYTKQIEDLNLDFSAIIKEVKLFKATDVWFMLGGQRVGLRVLNIVCVWIPITFLVFWVIMLWDLWVGGTSAPPESTGS